MGTVKKYLFLENTEDIYLTNKVNIFSPEHSGTQRSPSVVVHVSVLEEAKLL